MEGMTFIVKTQELTEAGRFKQANLHRWEYMTASDYETVETPYVVPNGKWVMERWVTPASVHDHCNPTMTHFVGHHQGLEMVVLERESRSERVLWISDSDQPFGTISWMKSDETWRPTGGIYFTSARQVHNGKLGQLTPIPQLGYVRENKAVVREWARGKRKARSNIGWVKLTELIATSGLEFEELIDRFWPFVDYKYDPHYPGEVMMDVLIGATAEQIKERRHGVLKFNKDEMQHSISEHLGSGNDVWIREGLAKTILRLIALDYKPLGATINA